VNGQWSMVNRTSFVVNERGLNEVLVFWQHSENHGAYRYPIASGKKQLIQFDLFPFDV
jgi:hypothetical protein